MKSEFDVYDYLIFFVVLFISIFIGLFFGLNLNEKLRKLFKLNKKKSTVSVEIELEENNGTENTQTNAEKSSQSSDNQKTMNFLTANSSMGAVPIALSLLATFFSSCNHYF